MSDSEIKLNKYNAEDYLTVETSQSELQEQRIGNYIGYYIDITVSVKSKVKASYSDAEFELELYAVSDKKLSSKTVTLEISENGECGETFTVLLQAGVLVSRDAYVFSECVIKSANGTVKLQ